MERFSIECRKTKTKLNVIKRVNQKKKKYRKQQRKLPKARENAGNQVESGFSNGSPFWLRRWREILD